MNDWIVCGNTKAGALVLECQRCDATYEPKTPVAFPMFFAMLEAFVISHKDCKEKKP